MIEIKKPYWEKILIHFEKKGYIQNGLTIPFLIGARKFIEPNEPLLSIREFIILGSKYGFTILKCPYIGEYVIGILDKETSYHKEIYFKRYENIIVFDNSLNEIFDIEALILFFEKCYNEHIIDEKYSRELGLWNFFSNVDIIKLNEMEKNY